MSFNVSVFSVTNVCRRILGAAAVALWIGASGFPVYAAAADVLDAPAKTYDIAGGPLGRVLSSFAASAGVALSFDDALTEGISSAGLAGSYTPRAGFAQLLSGSGLELEAGDDGSYTLRKAPPGVSTEAILPAVHVNAAATGSAFDAGITEGSGSYGGRMSDGATGLDLTARETPQSLSIVTRQQIEDQNLTSVAGALAQVPGITTDHRDSERYTFSTRGGETLNVMIDGRPANDYWFQTSNELTMIGTLDTATLDRIEVVRGSTGLMNGVGGYGGSVNLVRKRPVAGLHPQGSVGMGSWGHFRGEIDVSTDLTADGDMRSRWVAAVEDAGDYIDDYDGDSRVLYGIVETDLSPQTLLSVGLQQSVADIDGSSFTHIPLFFDDGSVFEASSMFNPAPPWTQSDQEATTLFADLAHELTDTWKLTLAASYFTGDLDLVRSSFASWAAPINKATGEAQIFRAVVAEEAERYSFDAKVDGAFDAFGRSHEAVIGINYNRAELSDLSEFYPVTPVNIYDWPNDLPPYPDPSEPPDSIWDQRHELTQAAVFGAVRLKPADPLAIILGTRYAYYKRDSESVEQSSSAVEASQVDGDTRFVPYAAAVYDFNRSLSGYVSYTDIFEPTSARDASGNFLSPMTGVTYEAGLKGEYFSGRLQPGLAVFRRDMENVPEETGDVLPGGEAIYRVIDGVVATGWEITVAGEPRPGWTLQGGLGETKLEDSDGEAVNPENPDKFFNVSTAWAATGRFTVGGNLTWLPERSTVGEYNGFETSQDSLTLLSMFASYRLNEKLLLSLNVENLTDREYYESFGSYEGYLYGLPRNAMVTLRYAP